MTLVLDLSNCICAGAILLRKWKVREGAQDVRGIRNSVLAMSHLKCLFDIQVEILNRPLYI